VSERSVAMVCPYDLTLPGGVQSQVLGLARSLAQRGWRVVVAAPGADPGCIEEPVELRSLGPVLPVRTNGSTAPISLDLLRAEGFARYLEREAIDVVHLHEPLAPVASWPLLLRHRLPMVATFHRSGIDALMRFGGRALAPLLRRIEVPVAVSAAAAETLAESCGIRSEILFNGVELAVSAAPSWPKEGLTVLFLGRDEPRKGRRVLLDAARLLPASVRIWVTGAPVASEGRSGATVEFLGTIGEEEKRRRLAAADVLCAPSLGGESFGLVLLEGLASGATVVASDIDGYRQALGGFGVLVAPDDSGALAAALSAALESGRQEPSEAQRAYLERWSMTALAAAYEERYEQLSGRGGPARPE
jgi:phosphatidylinositol alpha-mannosyltransferase